MKLFAHTQRVPYCNGAKFKAMSYSSDAPDCLTKLPLVVLGGTQCIYRMTLYT